MTQKMEKVTLQNSVEKVVEMARAQGISISVDELVKLVKTHSAGAAAAMVFYSGIRIKKRKAEPPRIRLPGCTLLAGTIRQQPLPR